MKNEEIIKVMESKHEDLIKIMESNHALTRAEVGALGDLMKIQFTQVKDKQDRTNGCISEHAKRLGVIEEELKPQGLIRKHWKLAVILLILLSYGIYTLYEIYSLADIIKAVK
jgi:hypothetical protein